VSWSFATVCAVDIVLTLDRPIMALVGGLEAPPGRIMGHAGAWAAPGEPDAQTKYQALERAGAIMVNHPEKFGEGMKTLLGNRATRPGTSVGSYRVILLGLS
jgi:succinyl-CoA synthetase alpha subunit